MVPGETGLALCDSRPPNVRILYFTPVGRISLRPPFAFIVMSLKKGRWCQSSRDTRSSTTSPKCGQWCRADRVLGERAGSPQRSRSVVGSPCLIQSRSSCVQASSLDHASFFPAVCSCRHDAVEDPITMRCGACLFLEPRQNIRSL